MIYTYIHVYTHTHIAIATFLYNSPLQSCREVKETHISNSKKNKYIYIYIFQPLNNFLMYNKPLEHNATGIQGYAAVLKNSQILDNQALFKSKLPTKIQRLLT